jgi:hypothetical protein
MIAPFGLSHGTVANPPLVDPSRKIVVAFDSGNARIAGLRYRTPGFEPLWEHGFGAGNHFILFPEAGEIVVNDHDGQEDHVVLLNIETGAIQGRVPSGSKMQSVTFQSPGWARDIYTCSFTTLTRTWIG